MKILHVIRTVDPRSGGPIEGIHQLHLPMLRLGHEVDVLSGDDETAPWVTHSKLTRVYALGPSYFGYGFSRKIYPWLRANVSRYDAVIVNGIWEFPALAAWLALSKFDVPYFVFTHGMLDPWFKKRYPVKHLKKWLYWPWASYRLLRDAEAVLFTCEEERVLARRSFWLYRAKEIVAKYGTSLPSVNLQDAEEKFLMNFPALRNKRIILFLSRVHRKKGCDILIDAFSRLCATYDDFHLVMAGPDQDGWGNELRARAETYGLGARISWVGMLQGDLKWGAFSSSEVFCLPSHQENFGIVVAEAMACGTPVIISNKVNIWREVEGANAGIVNDDTVEGTFISLVKWARLDDNQRAEMGLRAGAAFDELFNIEAAALRLVEIIEPAVAKSRLPRVNT